ncbi:MAG TPA: ATP-binding protein [Dokdonella sp.]
MSNAHADREVRVRWNSLQPVVCDRHRLAQLMSNLLANALSHGTPGSPVTILAETDERDLRIVVNNSGEPIPDDAIIRLFHPFTRASGPARKSGLGLGLFIASEIARAHRGTLVLTSSVEDGITFTFTMPIDGSPSR